MELKFETIDIHNFKSVRKVQYAYDPGTFLIKGVNEKDTFSNSNGSGKTSVFMDALVWVFTGYVSKGKKIKVLQKGADEMYVSVVFSLDGQSYRVVRSITKDGGKLLLFKGQDTEPYMDNVNKITKFFEDNRLTFELFTSVLFMTEKMTATFMESSPANKKGIIEDLSGVEIVQSVVDRADKLKGHYTQRASLLERLLNHLKGQKASFEKSKSMYESLDYAMINSEYGEIKKYLMGKYGWDGQNIKDVESKHLSERMAISNKQMEISQIESDTKRQISLISQEMYSLGQGKCPYCQRDFSNPNRESAIADEIIKHENTLAGVKDGKEKLTNSDGEIRRDQIKISRYSKLLTCMEDLLKVKTLDNEILQLDRKLKKLIVYQVYYIDKFEKISKFQNLLSRRIRTDLVALYVSNIQRELDTINSQFGTSIKLVQKSNDIEVSFDGKGYDELSGGESARCNIIIQSALRRLYRVNSNVKVYDEIFDALDETGIAQVLDFLQEFNSPNDTVYIISHNPNVITSDITVKTVVKKEDGFSYLE